MDFRLLVDQQGGALWDIWSHGCWVFRASSLLLGSWWVTTRQEAADPIRKRRREKGGWFPSRPQNHRL